MWLFTLARISNRSGWRYLLECRLCKNLRATAAVGLKMASYTVIKCYYVKTTYYAQSNVKFYDQPDGYPHNVYVVY